MKLQITLPDHSTEIVKVDEFNASELEEKIRDSNGSSVAIGNQLFWKIDIRHVKVIED